jgi:hypothetical protein
MLRCLYLWGMVCTEVKVQGNCVTRDALVNNERVLTHTINHVGSRVSVDVLYLHLSSLYDFMECPLQSCTLAVSIVCCDFISNPKIWESLRWGQKRGIPKFCIYTYIYII